MDTVRTNITLSFRSIPVLGHVDGTKLEESVTESSLPSQTFHVPHQALRRADSKEPLGTQHKLRHSKQNGFLYLILVEDGSSLSDIMSVTYRRP